MENAVKNCSIIILAAGRSERMGRPKQLLRYRGKTLLEHVFGEAKASNTGLVMVILGHDSDRLIAETSLGGAQVVLNRGWESGMASSIVSGIQILQKEHPETDSVIVMVCDQPFVDAELINRLVAKQQETGKTIVACEYDGQLGVPVLFCRTFFDQLLQLKGDSGAKKVINQNQDAVAAIPFPLGFIDIDTPEAYQKLDQNVI